jgi:hypothetical protein
VFDGPRERELGVTRLLFDRQRDATVRWPEALGMLTLSSLFAGVAVILATVPHAEPLVWIIGVIFACAAMLGLVVSVAHLYRQETLSVEDGVLKSRWSVGPFRGGWSLPIVEVAEVRAPARGREHMRGAWGIGVPALLVATRSGTVRCAIGVHPAVAQQIVERLDRERGAFAVGRRTSGCS